MLNQWVGLDDQVRLHTGSALATPFQDSLFDRGYMIHVGMNIADKHMLFKELFRLLRPGASFGIYDVMRIGNGDLSFPVPWATSAETSFLATVEQYKDALQSSGFMIRHENNRHGFALQFFKDVQARSQEDGGPSPLGLHTLMGATTTTKLQNMVKGVHAGVIAPVEIVAQVPSD